MGVLLQVRDVDESVRDRLKERAAERGLSLNSYVRDLLKRDVEVPSRAQVLARLAERGDLVDTPSLDVLKAARDERAW